MFAILQKYKFLAKVLGLQPYSEKYQLNQLIAIGYMISSISMVLMSSGNIVLHIYEKNVRKVAESAVGGFGFLMTFGHCFHMIFNQKRFIALHQEMNDIVNERIQLKGSDKLYSGFEQRFTFYLNMGLKVTSAITSLTLSPFVRVFYHLCMGQYTIHSWAYLYPFWLPFELDTVARCSTMGVIQLYAVVHGSFVFCAILSFFSGIGLYADALSIDIKSLFNRMDKLSKSKKNGSQLALLGYCKELIDLHVRLMDCLRKLADIMNMAILITVVPCAMSLCAALFLFQTGDGMLKVNEIIMPLLSSMSLLEILFAFTYFGEVLHTSLVEFNDMIYQSQWYQYPVGVQRSVMIMIIRAQRPFYISAYGLMHCKLENFLSVSKSVYSALMLLRKMYHN